MGLGRSIKGTTAWLLCAGASCGGGVIPRASAPLPTSELAKCKVAASQQSPLVTEWPASEKANLEARLREGGVVVAYSGCAMRLLPQCRVKGSYVWQRTTASTDMMEIHNEDELYAKLPLGAVSLEGELRNSGRLAVQTTVAGQLKLTGLTPADVPTGGECTGATHLIGSLSVGAFKLKSGGALNARGGVGVGPIAAARGNTTSSETLLRQAGNPDHCGESTDERPNGECASPIQMFLWPLPSLSAVEGPPGTVKVEFVAAEGDSTWDVVTGDKVLCTTPCSKWISPSTPVLMRAKESGFLARNKVEVPNLRDHAAEGPLAVEARSSSFVGFAAGTTVTSLGGMAMLTGLVLTPLGCTNTEQHGSMCTSGIIVGAVGAAVLVPGIWLIMRSGAHVEVGPSGPVSSLLGAGPPHAAWVLGPGYLGGQF
jgi:hypothetical protein